MPGDVLNRTSFGRLAESSLAGQGIEKFKHLVAGPGIKPRSLACQVLIFPLREMYLVDTIYYKF